MEDYSNWEFYDEPDYSSWDFPESKQPSRHPQGAFSWLTERGAPAGLRYGADLIPLGIMQALGEATQSLSGGKYGADFTQNVASRAEANKAAFMQALQENPYLTQSGAMLGLGAESIPLYAAGAEGAMGLLPGTSSLFQGLVGAGAGGAMTGASQYVEPGESRGEKALEESIASMLLPGLGVAGKAIPSIAKGATKYGKTFSRPVTAQVALEDFNNAMQNITKRYDDVYNANGLPRNTNYIPDAKNMSKIEQIGEAYLPKVNEFLNTQDILDAHWAQSDLGALIRNLEKKGTNITPIQKQALKAARAERAKIKEQIDINLNASGNPHLKDELHTLSKDFADAMKIYDPKLRKEFDLFANDYISSDDLMNFIQKQKAARTYRHKKADEIKGIDRAKYPETWKNLPISKQLVNFVVKQFGDK